ncbi:putative putidaredoxin reductase [Bordetella bronchiseptica MBORD635]|uniref:NAD(P)/FAD-dependent oxidoreductase n=1 Tax=Bordetella bronchiseptica TaxID=518 RepID=UPI000460E8C5|nr:FAD-dependent oxidoreductase [Bordetella bronchiseptica]KDC79467.1 putative putidaredoxin reductase [Bordetella bronchiseptica MBORD635]
MQHAPVIQQDAPGLVVVGAGCAGVEAAFAARNAGWQGPITLLGEESAEPYHRPPLSKAFLQGTAGIDSLGLKQAALYERAAIARIGATRVTRIDRAARRLHCADGRTLPYGQLVLACGGRARRLDEALAEGGGHVHYLRTLDDARGLRARLEHSRRVVIVGAGYVGLEVASACRALGLAVTVLEAAPRVLARVTAPVVSAFYEATHRGQGVDLLLDTGVAALEPAGDGGVAAVHTSDGQRIPTDLVIAGIGLAPNVELAREAGLAVGDGIVVDAMLRTEDPDILAIGDCALAYNPRYGRAMRIESVPNALEHARQAAATVCGKPRELDPLPWFWSDQYGLKLKMAGVAHGHDQVVVRGDPRQGAFSVFYLKSGQLLAVDTVNRPGEFMAARKLIFSTIGQADRLADETRELKHWLA